MMHGWTGDSWVACGCTAPGVCPRATCTNHRMAGIRLIDPRAPSEAAAPAPLPAGQSFAVIGRWRVYFNRHGAVGRPWCIAPEVGGWEVAVSSVGISTVAETVYRAKATPDDEDGRPSAWIAVDGYLTVHASGHASIGAP